MRDTVTSFGSDELVLVSELEEWFRYSVTETGQKDLVFRPRWLRLLVKDRCGSCWRLVLKQLPSWTWAWAGFLHCSCGFCEAMLGQILLSLVPSQASPVRENPQAVSISEVLAKVILQCQDLLLHKVAVRKDMMAVMLGLWDSPIEGLHCNTCSITISKWVCK